MPASRARAMCPSCMPRARGWGVGCFCDLRDLVTAESKGRKKERKNRAGLSSLAAAAWCMCVKRESSSSRCIRVPLHKVCQRASRLFSSTNTPLPPFQTQTLVRESPGQPAYPRTHARRDKGGGGKSDTPCHADGRSGQRPSPSPSPFTTPLPCPLGQRRGLLSLARCPNRCPDRARSSRGIGANGHTQKHPRALPATVIGLWDGLSAGGI